MAEPELQAGPWKRLGVLASGTGSNLGAVLSAMREGHLTGELVAVLSEKQSCPALDLAKQYGVETLWFPAKSFGGRKERDEAMAKWLRDHEVDLVLLAGYMQLVDPIFLKTLGCAAINIHPSLLPSFRGLHAVEQALEAGVQVTGCTLHFVVEDLDAGPILAQAAVPVKSDDSPESLHHRIQEAEHRIVVETLWRLERNAAIARGSRVIWE